MNQLDLALQDRDEGIERVRINNAEFVERAQEMARLIIFQQGDVTASDLRQRMTIEPEHPNAWGAVFRSKKFVATGDFRMSTQRQGHGNLNRVWRLA